MNRVDREPTLTEEMTTFFHQRAQTVQGSGLQLQERQGVQCSLRGGFQAYTPDVAFFMGFRSLET